MDNDIQPIFDVTDRGYRVRAFYVPDTLISPELAHLTITRNGALIRLGYCPAYSVWNVAAHFRDWVDDWLDEQEGHWRTVDVALQTATR